MTKPAADKALAVELVRGGMPQVDAAALVGVSHTSVQRWLEAAPAPEPAPATEYGGPGEVWITTPGIAALTTAAVLSRKSRVGKRALRVLCPAAGAGVYARAVLAFEPSAYIVAVEPRRSEIAGLSSFCAEVVHGAVAGPGADALVQAEGGEVVDLGKWWAEREPFDLIIDNPPFTWLTGIRSGRSVIGAGRHLAFRPLLRRGGLLALLGPSSYGQASSHQPAMREWAPAYQLRVTGRPNFGADPTQTGMAEISMWVWGTTSPPEWRTSQLPTHQDWLRHWAGPTPGTFQIPASIVDAVRETLRLVDRRAGLSHPLRLRSRRGDYGGGHVW